MGKRCRGLTPDEKIRDRLALFGCALLSLLISLGVLMLVIYIFFEKRYILLPIIIIFIALSIILHQHKKHHDIFYIIEKNDLEHLKKFLERNPDKVNSRYGKINRTPLHHAIYRGCSPEIMQILIDHRADVNARDMVKSTAVMDVAINKDENYLKYLEQKGVNLEKVDFPHYTPLHLAAILDNIEAVRLLVRNGADVNIIARDGSKPLHYTSYKNSKIMNLLISAGSSLEVRDINRKTPMDIACEHHFYPGMALLLRKGAELHLPGKDVEKIILNAVKRGNSGLIKAMVDRGINMNFTDKEGKTPLHWCTNRRRAAEVLINSGVPLNAVDNSGNTPLHYATNKSMAKLLLEKGADVTIKNRKGKTAFEIIGEID